MGKDIIKITWYGTSSVRISAGESQLLIDPFFPFSDSKIKVPRNSFDTCNNILVSHGHFDHISSIKEITRDDTTIYCTKAPYKSLKKQGIKKDNLHLIDVGSVLNIGELKITAYKGKHIKLTIWSCLKNFFSKRTWSNRKKIIRKLIKIAAFHEKKETLCYLIEYGGKRIFVLGSLALAEKIEYPTSVDLVFFPYQGSDKLFRIASEIYKVLKPKAVLLTHFDDTFPPFSSEIDTSEFEEYMQSRANVYKLNHGDTLEI